MGLVDRRSVIRLITVALPALALATVVVGVLQDALGVPNPSAVYLVPVVATALVAGTLGAIVTSLAAFLLYNFLFTEPRYTLSMHEPGVWLSVVLLLFVGVVVGQLAALQRSRAETAQAREREARALFRISRALATRESTHTALDEITTILRAETRMRRVWVSLGEGATERVVAEAGSAPEGIAAGAAGGLVNMLRRTPGDEPATWVRVHQPASRTATGSGVELYRVRLEGTDAELGSIWAMRERPASPPDRTETRLLAAAADQIGQVVTQDRLAADSRAAEVARQSDALKSALLQSVSHDLRTPLATIRTAAGTLRPGSGLSADARRENADAIDREVEYLDRLVANLLDLGRIEAGALRTDRDFYELDDVLRRAVERLERRRGDHPVSVAMAAPPVDVDPVLLDQAFTNVVENAIRHTPSGTHVRVQTRVLDDGFVRLTVEDDGPGVPAEAFGMLFTRFYRVPGPRHTRSGTGIGLAVVRGLIEALGGRVAARPSELGGLAIDLDLPRATVPAELDEEATA